MEPILEIVKIGDEVLREKCTPVKEFDSSLKMLTEAMFDELLEADGVGLAAPQIGILRRVVVIDCGDGIIEAINPEIIETSGEQGDFEGCLSFPGKHGYVIRPNEVVMRAYNRNGELMEYRGEGLLARAMLHECDHLDGHVYLEKVIDPPKGAEPPED